MQLSLVVNQRPWPRRTGIVTPLRTVCKTRKRRRLVASAFSVNHGAGAFCNGPKNSGGWIRTSDLRVMSPTSCQLLYPAIMQRTIAGLTRSVNGAF